MLSFDILNKVWAEALRAHALTILPGRRGPYRAIGDKSLRLLDALWAARATLVDLGALIEAGKTVRFWSDPHLEHENILRLAKRVEFQTVEAMNQTIWDNVMEALRTSDFVLCLGDLALKNPLFYQRRLHNEHGPKQATIVGNHDAKGAKPGAWAAAGAIASLAFSLPTALLQGWMLEDHADLAELVDWKRLPARIQFGCSHWPVPPARLPGPGWVNLHGHIHNRTAGPLRVNCSVEAVRYRPKTLRDLLTPELFDDLVRRQSGLDGFDAPAPGETEESEHM